MRERIFFHAVNVFYGGDYPKLSKARDNFDSWEAAWDYVRKEAKFEPEAEWEKLEDQRIGLVLNGESSFPVSLIEAPLSPFGLYFLGALPAGEPAVAIVGTRRATASGKMIAKNFSENLALAGVTIVSGLALGIDTAAHEGALLGHGKTIGVLAGGVDSIYPRQNDKLAKKIIESGGAIVSEYPPGAPTYPYRFLDRNRIISGLSRGTLVVEAPEGSGALATVRFALDQNRAVFVVPGPIGQLHYKGSNSLIRQGAALVTSAREILEELNLIDLSAPSCATVKKPIFLDKKQSFIFDILKSTGEPINIDKRMEISKMDISAVNQVIGMMQIQGIIKEESGHYFLI